MYWCWSWYCLSIRYSTGGLDVPPLILNKKFGISLPLAINVEDSLILIGQVFFSSFEGILYGIITVLVSTIVMDRVIVFGERNIQVFVISKQHEKITKLFLTRLIEDVLS